MMKSNAHWLALVAAALLLVVLWTGHDVERGVLVTEVNTLGQWANLETTYLYAFLHLISFVPVFALSFDKRVHYYTSWKALLPAIAIVGGFFIIWDVFFTHIGVWDFNPDYFMGIKWLALPVEEWLFFFTIPFAVVFIYRCLNAYFPRDVLSQLDRIISWALIGIFTIVGIIYWGHLYTSTTFLLSAILLAYHYYAIPNTYRTRFYLAYLISWIPFLIINGVLTGVLTESPVVLYNPAEYLDIRIVSVPLDDSVYSFLLLLGTVSLMEFFEKRWEEKSSQPPLDKYQKPIRQSKPKEVSLP
ncbi:MAG: lycopene cyclase domain-containing protein [Bacteroidota bacterium]